MPKKYRRNCDECGRYYEGAGARYCAIACAQNARRPERDKLPEPDDTVRVEGELVTLLSSKAIKDPKELLERSGLDLDVWEMVPDSGVMKTWAVPMKVEGYPVQVPCFYVSLKVRKRWDASDLPTPIVLSIERPKKSESRAGDYTSVHYSDIHFPHHDPRTLDILYQILDDVGPHLVWDHGDTLDCEQISKYPKDPFHRVGMKEEIRLAANHFGVVQGLTPNAEHGWCEGNHEERLRRLIWSMAEDRRAGEILTLDAVRDALQWGALLGIGELGWEIVNYPNHKLLHDKLILCHGEKVRAESGASEKAEYMKYGKGGISGHTHRVGFYGRTDYNGVHGWWGLGMMGKVRSDYTSFPNWQQGFAVVTWNKDKTEYHVERVRIFDGVAFFRGRRYEGSGDAEQGAVR